MGTTHTKSFFWGQDHMRRHQGTREDATQTARPAVGKRGRRRIMQTRVCTRMRAHYSAETRRDGRERSWEEGFKTLCLRSHGDLAYEG